MTGGPSQQARVTAFVDRQHRDRQEAFNRASHGDALPELQLVAPGTQLHPAEDLQADPPIGDAVGVIQSIGWRRLAIAAAFAATVWISTAAFAVMCGGPR